MYVYNKEYTLDEMFKQILIALLIDKGYAFKVNLFTGKACRQCIRFNRIFQGLVDKYPDVNFEKIELYGGDPYKEGYIKAKRLKINVVPMVVFENEHGEEESRITAVSKNYKEIEEICKKYSSLNNPNDTDDAEIPSYLDKKCEWVIKEMETHDHTVLTNEHLRLSKLCDNIYSDKFLRSSAEYVDNEDTDTQCGMSIHGRQLIICFRGSDSATDWRLNFYATLSEFPCGSGKYVHSGFLAQWLSVQTEFTSKFFKMIDKYAGNIDEVVFCGHSSGTVSCLAAYTMEPVITEIYKKVSKVVTYGAPRMCNDLFKKHLEEKVDCTRIVLDRDVITRVPFPFFGYTHIGKPIQVRENCVFERDTTTLESLHWMILGLPSADVGIRDHFIYNYTVAIEQWLKEQGVELDEGILDRLEPIITQPMGEEGTIEETVVNDPVIQETVSEEPVVEEPVEPVVEEPVEPVVEEPVEPVVEEPV